jgi:lysophospholipase L1-like esterase
VTLNGAAAPLAAAIAVSNGTVTFGVSKAGVYVATATVSGTTQTQQFDVTDTGTVTPVNPMSKVRAAMAGRDSKTVVVAFAGSSTVAGTGATNPAQRFVNLVSDSLQNRYETSKPTAVRTLAQALAAAPLGAGLHFVNAGVGGTEASNYLTATTGPQLATLNPNVIVHMVGSNDYANGTSVATFKANLSARIAQLDSGITIPHVHIIVQAHQRRDVTGAQLWSDFGKAMQEVAAADPASRIFVDTTDEFEAIGFPTGDPLGYFSGDNVHLNNSGHMFMADIISEAIGIGFSHLDFNRTRYTSDTFTGANAADVNGRALDVNIGGAARTWTLNPAGALGITNNALTVGGTPAAGFLSVPTGSNNLEITVTVTTKPTAANGIYLDLRREAAALSGTSTSYRALLTDTVVFIQKRVSGTTTNIGTNVLYNNGDKVTLRAIGNRVDLLINGVLADSVNDTSVPSGGFAGIACTGTGPHVIDDVVINYIDVR